MAHAEESHDEEVDLVDLYLDGALDAEAARALEMRATTDAALATVIGEGRQLDAIARAVLPPAVSDAEWGACWQGVAARTVGNQATAARTANITSIAASRTSAFFPRLLALAAGALIVSAVTVPLFFERADNLPARVTAALPIEASVVPFDDTPGANAVRVIEVRTNEAYGASVLPPPRDGTGSLVILLSRADDQS